MKNIIKLLVILVVIISLNSCKKEISNNLVVGTFNVEWLGDGTRDRIDRTEEDYKNIANIILDMEADIIGLQEIENENALLRILKYLPDYKSYISSGGNQQKLAIISKSNIIIKDYYEYTDLAVEENRTRPGLVVSAQKGDFQWTMLVVHLKSTSRYDNTAEKKEGSQSIREKQASVISYWADSIIKNNSNHNLIIVGDFNDTPVRKKNPTLTPLLKNNFLFFLTESLKSCKYPSWYVIDHIIVSENMLQYYEENSLFIYNFREKFPDYSLKLLSDHCPISASFNFGK